MTQDNNAFFLNMHVVTHSYVDVSLRQNEILPVNVYCEPRQATRSAAVRSGTFGSLIRRDGAAGNSRATGEC